MRTRVGPPLEPWTALPTFDPNRTRLSFLGALPAGKQKRFVAEAQKNADAALALLDARIAAFHHEAEPFEYLVLLGTREELRARKKWLREVGEVVGG